MVSGFAFSNGSNLCRYAESGVMPRKREEIKGVSGASILSLQAQLYKGKEAAKGSEDAAAERKRARWGAAG
jgi:hypothetical protein